MVRGALVQYGVCWKGTRSNQLTVYIAILLSMELRLNSPSGGEAAVYQWPLVTAVSRHLCETDTRCLA